MTAGEDTVSDIDNGFLTEQMQEYLENPVAFEEGHDEKTVKDVRYRIRQAREDAIEELRFLDTRQEDWIREQPAGVTYFDPEDHVEMTSLHAPLPVSRTIDIPLHEDTVDALQQVRDALNELVIDELVKEIDELPPEFNSRQEFRDYLLDHAMEVRSEWDGQQISGEDTFWGDNFITYDDVIRQGLMLFPDEETVRDMKMNEFASLPGINYQERAKLFRRYARRLEKPLLMRS